MPQNIYDDPEFFRGYKHLRDTASGLNEVLEQPALRALLPNLMGCRVLELGCGMGAFAAWCVEQGAAQVVGVDISAKMLAVARREHRHPRIEYRRASIEEAELPAGQFDLVVSSLALHYVEDYAGVVERVYRWLRSGGLFVFSVEHPICTAQSPMQGWIRDAAERKLYWAVDDYGDEGRREQRWFVEGVVKYHRTLATYLNTLIQAGFHLERIEEPHALPSAVQTRPELADEQRRPPFLLVKAQRPPSGPFAPGIS